MKVLKWLLALIVLGGIAYGVGSWYYEPDRQIYRLSEMIVDPTKDASSVVIPSQWDLKITNQNLKPVQKYFAKNTVARNRLLADIKARKSTGTIQLTTNGSYWLLFPRYVLRIAVFRPQVKTNHAHSTLYLNNKRYSDLEGSGNSYYADLGYRLPGRYNLMIKSRINGKEVKTNAVVNLWKQETIDMSIKTVSFIVKSVPNGQVYLNDKFVKNLDESGEASFDNYRITKKFELRVKSNYDGKEIWSDKVTNFSRLLKMDQASGDDYDNDNNPDFTKPKKHVIYKDEDGNYVVSPNWVGILSPREAGQTIYQMYKSPDKDQFKNEADYKKFAKLSKQIYHKHKKAKLSIYVTNILPAGDNYSDVSYTAVFKYKKWHKTINLDHALFKQDDDQIVFEKFK
ncbi:MAG: hypothetical protein Q3960_03515 [Lactobacillus sp.]|nr:hypothetical protein [Lactobacillus sp.]